MTETTLCMMRGHLPSGPVEHLVERWVVDYGYVSIFLLMAASSACIPIPSEVILLVGGWYGATGRLSLLAVILLALAGNLAGSLLTFYIGRRTGRATLERYGRYVGIRQREIGKAELWWDRHGPSATFFSRMVPVLRTYISIAAGFAEMSTGRFLTYTIAGIIPWTLGLILTGYYVRDRWTAIASFFGPLTIAMACLLALAIYLTLRGRRRRLDRRDGKEREAEADQTPVP